MSNKRLQILQGDLDQQALDWLNAQTNMSATIRLMIYQASRSKKEDYVMACAKQSSGAFGPSSSTPTMTEQEPSKQSKQEVTEPLKDTKPANETPTEKNELKMKVPNKLKSVSRVDRDTDKIDSKDSNDLEPETSKPNEAGLESQTDDSDNLDSENTDNESSDEKPTDKSSVDWDKMEDEKSDTITRMMADLGR